MLLADRIISPNHFTVNYVAKIIGKKRAERKVSVIPWILYEKHNPAVNVPDVYRTYGLNPDLPFILLVGFLNKYKFTDIMYNVIDRLKERSLDDVQFVFCGDGPLRAEGEERFKDTGQVFFLGWQDNLVVRTLIRKARIILVPMSGFVLLEAGAEGKAVIASNIEWHPEMIEDGVNGFLVDPESTRGWADRIQTLLADDQLCIQMGENLKHTFNEKYRPDVLVDKELNLYIELLSQGQGD